MTNPVDLTLYKPLKAIWDTQANPGLISLTTTQREFYTQALQQLDAMAPELANSPTASRFYVNLEGTGDDYLDTNKIAANPSLLYKDQMEALKTAPPGTPTPVIEPGIGTRLADNNLLTNFVDAALAITAIPHVLQALKNLAVQVKIAISNNTEQENASAFTPTIVITGFSRGAAEARILMNILDAYGIPDPLDPVFDVLQPTNTNLPDQRLTYADLHFGTNTDLKPLVSPYSTTGTTNIPVYAILFDTVVTSMEKNPFTIPNNVQKIVQLVSLDERRYQFPLTSLFPTTSISPTLSNIWEFTTASNSSTKLVEVSLPGVHADIGGGYSGNNVSSATLTMATTLLEKWGFLQDDQQSASSLISSDIWYMHDSRTIASLLWFGSNTPTTRTVRSSTTTAGPTPTTPTSTAPPLSFELINLTYVSSVYGFHTCIQDFIVNNIDSTPSQALYDAGSALYAALTTFSTIWTPESLYYNYDTDQLVLDSKLLNIADILPTLNQYYYTDQQTGLNTAYLLNQTLQQFGIRNDSTIQAELAKLQTTNYALASVFDPNVHTLFAGLQAPTDNTLASAALAASALTSIDTTSTPLTPTSTTPSTTSTPSSAPAALFDIDAAISSLYSSTSPILSDIQISDTKPTLVIGLGNDTLLATHSNTTLLSLNGNNTLISTATNATILTGSLDDTVFATAPATIYLSTGTDVVTATNANIYLSPLPSLVDPLANNNPLGTPSQTTLHLFGQNQLQTSAPLLQENLDPYTALQTYLDPYSYYGSPKTPPAFFDLSQDTLILPSEHTNLSVDLNSTFSLDISTDTTSVPSNLSPRQPNLQHVLLSSTPNQKTLTLSQSYANFNSTLTEWYSNPLTHGWNYSDHMAPPEDDPWSLAYYGAEGIHQTASYSTSEQTTSAAASFTSAYTSTFSAKTINHADQSAYASYAYNVPTYSYFYSLNAYTSNTESTPLLFTDLQNVPSQNFFQTETATLFGTSGNTSSSYTVHPVYDESMYSPNYGDPTTSSATVGSWNLSSDGSGAITFHSTYDNLLDGLQQWDHLQFQYSATYAEGSISALTTEDVSHTRYSTSSTDYASDYFRTYETTNFLTGEHNLRSSSLDGNYTYSLDETPTYKHSIEVDSQNPYGLTWTTEQTNNAEGYSLFKTTYAGLEDKSSLAHETFANGSSIDTQELHFGGVSDIPQYRWLDRTTTLANSDCYNYTEEQWANDTYYRKSYTPAGGYTSSLEYTPSLNKITYSSAIGGSYSWTTTKSTDFQNLSTSANSLVITTANTDINFDSYSPSISYSSSLASYSISADYSYTTNTITLSDSSGGYISLNPDALYSSTITTPDGTTFNTADLLAQTTATVGYSSPYTYFSQTDAANALFSHSSALQALEAYELAMGGRDILADFLSYTTDQLSPYLGAEVFPLPITTTQNLMGYLNQGSASPSAPPQWVSATITAWINPDSSSQIQYHIDNISSGPGQQYNPNNITSAYAPPDLTTYLITPPVSHWNLYTPS